MNIRNAKALVQNRRRFLGAATMVATCAGLLLAPPMASDGRR